MSTRHAEEPAGGGDGEPEEGDGGPDWGAILGDGYANAAFVAHQRGIGLLDVMEAGLRRLADEHAADRFRECRECGATLLTSPGFAEHPERGRVLTLDYPLHDDPEDGGSCLGSLFADIVTTMGDSV